MAFPSLINAASPADVDNPAAGAAQIRALKQFLEDLLGLTDSTNYTVNGITISTTGVVSFSIAPVLSALNASFPVFTDASKNLTSAGTVGAAQGGTGLTTYTTGDLPYASAAATIAKLSVVANAKVFGNAAGTAPEYATGIKLGSFTRDISIASGTQQITGVGFKPSLVAFFANVSGNAATSIGATDGVTKAAVYNRHNVVANTWYSVIGYFTSLAMTGSDEYDASAITLDADGFTITWTRTGSPTGTATGIYLVWR